MASPVNSISTPTGSGIYWSGRETKPASYCTSDEHAINILLRRPCFRELESVELYLAMSRVSHGAVIDDGYSVRWSTRSENSAVIKRHK